MKNSTGSQIGFERGAEAPLSDFHRVKRGRGRPVRPLEVAHHGNYDVNKATVRLFAIEFLKWLGDRNRVSNAKN